MPHDVFISYASPDAATATAVCDSLEADGVSCWIAPRDVEAGVEYAEAIVTAIRSSRVILLVFSAAANDSVHVRRELDRAVSAGLAVLPLRIEELEPSGALDYYLAGRQWCDAFDAPLEPHLERLRAAVNDLLAEKEHTPQVHGAARKRTPLVLAGAAVLVLAVVAALAVWALMPSKTPGSAGTSRDAKTMTAAQTAAKYGASVVRITTPLMPPSATGTRTPSRIVGSGFMASKDGWIVTSLAVVQGRGMSPPLAVTVEYALPTGEYRKAMGKVFGHSEQTGIALIKVDPRKVPLKPLPPGDSDSIAKGEWVTALGAQSDLSLQQATGLVTDTRTLKDTFTGNDHIYELVDNLNYPAAIQSQPLAGLGGPLFDNTGQVVAAAGPPGDMTGTWGYSGDVSKKALGIWWASRDIKFAGEHNWGSGWSRVVRHHVGLAYDWLTPRVAQGLGEPAGALVDEVFIGSPAARAGIRPHDSLKAFEGVPYGVGGDVIVSADGVRLTGQDQLATIFGQHHVGDVIALGLVRAGRHMIVNVTLAALP